MSNSNDAIDKKLSFLFALVLDSEDLLTKSEKALHGRLTSNAVVTLNKINDSIIDMEWLRDSYWSLLAKKNRRFVLFNGLSFFWLFLLFFQSAITEKDYLFLAASYLHRLHEHLGENFTLFALATIIFLVTWFLCSYADINIEIQENTIEREVIKSNQRIFLRDLVSITGDVLSTYQLKENLRDCARKETREQIRELKFKYVVIAALKSSYCRIFNKIDSSKLEHEELESRRVKRYLIYERQIELAIIRTLSTNPKFHNEAFYDAITIEKFMDV